MTISYTTHFRFGIPDFTTAPWHETFEALVQDIDRALFGALLGAGFTVWENDATYAIGDTVIDPDDGSLWFALLPNTSPSTPTTFAQDRANNPSNWGSLVGSVSGVNGPGASTDNAIARWNGSTGSLLQNSKVTLSDDGGLTMITTPFTDEQAILINQQGAVSPHTLVNNHFNYNYIQILGDHVEHSVPNWYTSGLNVYLQCTGDNSGSKAAITALVQHATPPTTPAVGRDHVAIVMAARADAHDGGTDLGAGARGTLYSSAFIAQAAPGATNFFVVSGGEIDTILEIGASCKHRWGLSFPGNGSGQGSDSDAAIQISGVSVAGRWQNGILFSRANGTDPVTPTGTLIGTDGQPVTCGIGIDFAAYSMTYVIRGPNSRFYVDGNANIVAANVVLGGLGLNTGNIQFNAILGGTVSFNFPAFVTGTRNVVFTDASGTVPVTATAPLAIDPANGNLSLSVSQGVIALTDGASVPLDATLGNIFSLIAAGDRTIQVPIGPPAAGQTQKIIIRHQASGANRTLTLTAGVNGFRFGSTFTGLTATISGKTDYIGCIWNQPDARWDVVAYSKGF